MKRNKRWQYAGKSSATTDGFARRDARTRRDLRWSLPRSQTTVRDHLEYPGQDPIERIGCPDMTWVWASRCDDGRWVGLQIIGEPRECWPIGPIPKDLY
jgi:hypothetical protein